MKWSRVSFSEHGAQLKFDETDKDEIKENDHERAPSPSMLKEPSLVHIIRTGRLSVSLASSLSSSGGSNHFLNRCTSMSRSPKRRNEGTRLPRQMMGRKQNSGPAIQNSDDTIIGELHSRSVPRGPKEPTEKKPASVCFHEYSPAAPARNLRENFREGVQSLCL